MRKKLVFIPGLHLDEKSWDSMKEFFPKDEFDLEALPRIDRELASPSITTIAQKCSELITANSVLVVHSFAGAIATAMFGICPEKIKSIIYVSAAIPKNGETTFERVTDKEGQANYAKAVTVENKIVSPREKNIFFAEMDPKIDLKNTKLPKIYPESSKISSGVVTFDEAKFRALPKMYIITDNDNVVTVDTQRMFLKGAGIHKTAVIPTGHFPMISNPKVLADTIISFLKVPVVVAKGA